MYPIILPYLDCPDLTRAAAQDALLQSLPLPPTLLLIDNGSVQEASRALRGEIVQSPSSRVLSWRHQPPLLSLAATWNHALKFCWEAGADQALVINNDVRIAPWTYALLLEVQRNTGAHLVSAVSVTQPQYETYLELGLDAARLALGTLSESRKDGVRPEGYSYGGPDFSCFLMTREGHQKYQFDEEFIPAYHEDNDFHRRMTLNGEGDRIFGVNLPFWHVGSATLKENAYLQVSWAERFRQCQAYYREKWGGLPGEEQYLRPFNQEPLQLMYEGQGRGTR